MHPNGRPNMEAGKMILEAITLCHPQVQISWLKSHRSFFMRTQINLGHMKQIAVFTRTRYRPEIENFEYFKSAVKEFLYLKIMHSPSWILNI
jgi:hypothetical protein